MQGERGMYAAGKARQNAEAAWECVRVAEEALAAGERDRAVRCQLLPLTEPSALAL